MKEIIFYAPVGNLIKGFKNGGAEAGCRKTIEILRKEGYNVILVEKPAKESSNLLGSIGLIFDLIKIWFVLMSKFIKHRHSTLHVAGFYLNQVYFEWLIISTAKIFQVNTVYEIRNGGMIESYIDSNNIYKFFLKSVFLKSTLVLCQGFDYVVFLKDNFNINSIYYPNYIMDNFVEGQNYIRDSSGPIQLIYFGRVVPDKNIDFIIEVCDNMKNMGLNFMLNIIGGYEESYHSVLMNKISSAALNDFVKFHGRMEFKDIHSFLKMSHFFVFPSKEKREGHSNSLTEAMGCGVVPIVSTAGFNSSVVGDTSLVISTFDASLYASNILRIWKDGCWQVMSDNVYNRVVSNYTEKVVKSSLLNAYKSLN